MTPSVEMLFFGRPVGLEASHSVLLHEYKDSLYPETGITGGTDGLIWRIQFMSPGDKPVQIISCFKAMGSPNRGAGGFIGVAIAMASQFKLSEALAAHLNSELDRFVALATDGKQFLSEQTTEWPTPRPYPLAIEPRGKLYSPSGGVQSFIGTNLDASRTAEQIEHSLRVNLPKGATTAHFLDAYQGDRKDVVDLSAQSTSVTDEALISTTAGSSLGLELEINELKKSIKQSQIELVQTKELLHAETQKNLGKQRELEDALSEVDRLRGHAPTNGAPRSWLWMLLGTILGAAGVYFTLVLPAKTKQLSVRSETSLGEAQSVVHEAEKEAIDVINTLQERALTLDEMTEFNVFEDVVRLTDFPHAWMDAELLNNRFKSIVDLIKSQDAEFNGSKFCEPCLRYNVPFIQKSEYKLSVLEEFESEDPQVRKWMNVIVNHAIDNPLFSDGETWTVYQDEDQPLGNDTQPFGDSDMRELCSEANLPGDLIDGPKSTLCWEINRYAFNAPPNDEQKYFMKWRLQPRD